MAREFNGTNQYLYAATAVAGGPPLAMSCWFKASWYSEGTLMSISNSAAAGNFYRLAVVAEDVELEVENRLIGHAKSGPADMWAISPNEYVPMTWHHAFCLFPSATMCQVWLDRQSYYGSNLVTPSGLNHTQVGGLNDGAGNGGSQLSFYGQIAEAAIWAATGVENMGDREVDMLADGHSPLCLREWLPYLVLYQDLIRPLNRPGLGPTFSAAGSPGVTRHPRGFYPTSLRGWAFPPHQFAAPYRHRAGQSAAPGAENGAAAVSGAATGQTQTFGEVSS
jgi:hypothetical protein